MQWRPASAVDIEEQVPVATKPGSGQLYATWHAVFGNEVHRGDRVRRLCTGIA